MPDPPLVPLMVGGHPVVPAIIPSTASSSKPAPTLVTEAICDEIIEDYSIVEPDGLKGGDIQESLMAQFRLPDHVVQVLNEKSKTVHLSGGDGTICHRWQCGTAKVPAKDAEFSKTHSRWTPCRSAVSFCIGCHSLRAITKCGGALVVDGEPVIGSSSSGSESSSSSSTE